MAVLYEFLFIFLAFGALQCVVTKVTSIKEQQIRGKLGGEANLTCDGITDYQNTVLLFNNTSIVVRPEKFQKLPNGAVKILDIQPPDTGTYTYKQSSVGSMNYCIIRLKISEETIIKKPGLDVIMSCKVSAPVEIWNKVLWKRKYSSETKTIVNNGSVSEFAKQNFSGRISASGKKLVILNSKKGDSGKYICIVELKDISQRDNYYINLVVRMSSTIKPTTNEVMTSDKYSTSTPFPATSITKGATKRKSCAARISFYLPLAILISLPFLV